MFYELKVLPSALRWRLGQLRRLGRNRPLLLARMTSLGAWLETNDYVGIDVNANNPPSFIATVPASTLIGWLNLADFTGNPVYSRKADACVEMILADQKAEGCWLFPYRFRENPPGFPYACENFMTVEGLMAFAARIKTTDQLMTAIDKALRFLLGHVGHDRGAFFYSPADKIRIPNISSMAARVFSEAAPLLAKTEYQEHAALFARYCVSQQEQDGSYPYAEGTREVSVPYHALETWELAEANRRLNDPEIGRSLTAAIEFLDRTLMENDYSSFYPQRGRSSVMKTPIWSARAFLSMGFVEKALAHFWRGLELFGLPGTDHYFYVIQDYHGLRLPWLDTPFIRYNASVMEIGSSLLCRIQ